jgi:hypothetical protein
VRFEMPHTTTDADIQIPKKSMEVQSQKSITLFASKELSSNRNESLMN